MPNVDKIIEKMKWQPHGIRVAEADRVLSAYGYILDRQHGSHRQYMSNNGDVITIPERNPLKKAYIDAILARIGKN
jgi:predicted RNA binding protein YcfA (HicA-like mRNA interferase family)